MAIKSIQPKIRCRFDLDLPLSGPVVVHAQVVASFADLPEVEPRTIEVSVPFGAGTTRAQLIQSIRDAAVAVLQNEGNGGHTVA